MTGLLRIAEEREHQREQWSSAHDDEEHAHGDLATAAATIAGDHLPRYQQLNTPDSRFWGARLAARWRGDRLRQLQVAGALIAAEIDRLARNPDARIGPPGSTFRAEAQRPAPAADPRFLDVAFGDLRIRCSAAAGRDMSQREIDGLDVQGGDVVLSFNDYAFIVVRLANRREVAAAIAPPGALIGTPPEITPLLEDCGPGGGGC